MASVFLVTHIKWIVPIWIFFIEIKVKIRISEDKKI